MFPTTERIAYKPTVKYETNNIIMYNALQYGHMGTGKTETCRSIVEQAVSYYGEENVNAVGSEGDLNGLLLRGFDNKLVQIMVIDDATLARIDDDDIRNYFRIRHIYKEKTGKSNGFILTIFNVHRFHSIQTELRSSIDVALWRSCLHPNTVVIPIGIITGAYRYYTKQPMILINEGLCITPTHQLLTNKGLIEALELNRSTSIYGLVGTDEVDYTRRGITAQKLFDLWQEGSVYSLSEQGLQGNTWESSTYGIDRSQTSLLKREEVEGVQPIRCTDSIHSWDSRWRRNNISKISEERILYGLSRSRHDRSENYTIPMRSIRGYNRIKTSRKIQANVCPSDTRIFLSQSSETLSPILNYEEGTSRVSCEISRDERRKDIQFSNRNRGNIYDRTNKKIELVKFKINSLRWINYIGYVYDFSTTSRYYHSNGYITHNSPTNPYDRSVVKKFVGDDGIEDLEYIESVRMENPSWNSVIVFTSRIWRGLALIPLAEKDYIKTLPAEPLPSLSALLPVITTSELIAMNPPRNIRVTKKLGRGRR